MHTSDRLSVACIVAVMAMSSAAVAYGFDPLPEQVPFPADNPSTPEKIELGKMLYFDTRISSTGTISCNSCHNVMDNGTDKTSFSLGVGGKIGGRRSPTVWNSAFNSVQFWDGRAPSLEEQAKGPMINPVEMGMADHNAAVGQIAKVVGYQKRFKEVFGGEKSITIENIVKAIATYERTLITPNSPFDLFVKGNKNAINADAKKGMQLVQTVGCVACHSGTHFSGPPSPAGQGFYMKFPLIAGSEYEKKYRLTDDLGRFQATHDEKDKNMWRVPSWRNVAIRAPYFHNGSVKTLDEAVRVMAKTQLNKVLTDQEVKQIVEFLKSLTGKAPKQTLPKLPES